MRASGPIHSLGVTCDFSHDQNTTLRNGLRIKQLPCELRLLLADLGAAGQTALQLQQVPPMKQILGPHCMWWTTDDPEKHWRIQAVHLKHASPCRSWNIEWPTEPATPLPARQQHWDLFFPYAVLLVYILCSGKRTQPQRTKLTLLVVFH